MDCLPRFALPGLTHCLATHLAGCGGLTCAVGVPCGPVPRYDGNRPAPASPVAVTGALVYRSIGVGGMATCGIGDVGGDYCWGWNEVGALGKPIVAH